MPAVGRRREDDVSRSVLVTGGNRGIGLAVARAFAADGDKVAITYRTGSPPDELFGVRCDVTDADDVARTFAEVAAQQGPVQVLVANAGINREALLLGMPEDAFRDVIETNLMGAVRCAKAAITDMVRARWGRLIFMSSTVGFAGSAAQSNYSASKAALMGVARSLAWELGKRNITSNVIVPGYIDTDMTKDITDRRRDFLLDSIALHRIGTPDEVSGVARFLASSEASYITGALIPVSGGLGMGH
jgi:3-oxoacyl-[acyl-carrier protein] reductase